jgi:pimeloyl-ACP methyl ester carboxylesterase
MALSPGGRRGMDELEPLAARMAAHGYRVVLHDRRNCGLSDLAIDPAHPEYELWADDLYALLEHLGALPGIVGGGSSGCRLSILMALKYPQAVRALLLWRVTGGRFAAERLARKYYGQYIEAAKAGGMAAVCATDHFKERIAVLPAHRATLMAMDVRDFIAAMETGNRHFLACADQPVIGASERELNSIKIPTLVIPGNDRTHNHAVAEAAHRMIPGSTLHDLFPGDLDVDIVPMEDWAPREAEMAAVLAGFLKNSKENQHA